MNVSCVFSLTRYEVCRRLPSEARRKTRWRSILVIFIAFGSFSLAVNQVEGFARSTSAETPAVIHQPIGDDTKANPRTEVSAAEFYDTLNVDTLDDEDEIIGSDGTLRLEPDDSSNPDNKNVHDVLELIEDGRLYPILSKDETSEYTPRSDTNDYTTKNNDVYSEADDEKNANDKFEQSDAKRRKRDDFANKNKQATADANRDKREAANIQPPRKVKTGDTILNIHGSVKDAITDLGSSNLDNISRPRNQNGETSHIDTIVIHPSQYLNKDLDETVSVAQLSERRIAVKEETNDTLEAKRAKTLKLGESDVFKAKSKDVEPPDKSKFKEIFTEKQARLVLDCDLPKNVTVNSWTKDGHAVLLGPGQSLRVRWAADTRGLLITRAAREDDGRWACEGRDTTGRLQRSTPYNLLVYEESRPPYLELDGRRLDAGNTWAPAREGVVLDVLCVSEGGQPAAELSWAIVGGRTDDLLRHLSVHSLNYTAGSSASRARLAVGRAHHNATLECRAAQRRPRAAAATRRAALQLDVAYPPSFTISRTPGFGRTLVTGNTATLHCAVDANPPARAAWRHGDAAAAAGARLQFAALGAEHAGWYRCVARYGETDYTSIGYYLSVRADAGEAQPVPPASAASKPTPAASPPRLVDVELGGTVQLHCPKGSVGCWTKKQHSIDEGKRDEKGTASGRRTNNGTKDIWVPTGSQHAHGVLGVVGALYQQAGEYRCVGASADDAQRLRELRRLTLRVIGSPAVYARAVRPAGGGGARLAAQVCARPLPARVLWLLQDRALSPGSQLPHYRALALQPSDAPDCWEAELIAGPGAPSSEVWLVARNDRGVADAVFRPAPRNRALAASTASARPAMTSAAAFALTAAAILVLPT